MNKIRALFSAIVAPMVFAADASGLTPIQKAWITRHAQGEVAKEREKKGRDKKVAKVEEKKGRGKSEKKKPVRREVKEGMAAPVATKPLTPIQKAWINRRLKAGKITAAEAKQLRGGEVKSTVSSEVKERISKRAAKALAKAQALTDIPTTPEERVAAIAKHGKRPSLVVAGKSRMPVPSDWIGQKYGSDANGLDSHQRYGINAALERFLGKKEGTSGKAFLLGDGPGVGKTRMLLGTAVEMAKATGKPILIITANQQVIDGSFAKDAKAMGIDLAKSNITLGTYADLSGEKFRGTHYGMVAYDECHMLKSVGSDRSAEARFIMADHKLFSTATAMDRPTAAPYFLSEVTGVSEDVIQKRLGYTIFEKKVIDDKGKEKILQSVTVNKGMSWPAINRNIAAMRDEAVGMGGMVRREYPYFGKVREKVLNMTPVQLAEQAKIETYWNDQMAAATTMGERLSAAGQLTGELSRWTEGQKIDAAFEAMKRDLAEGKKVILCGEFVKPTNLKALGEQRAAFVGEMAKRLEAAGIPFARVYGKGKKGEEVAKFQRGEVNVCLMTPKSGGAGINLDDTHGTAPRSMYVITQNYAGDVFQQILGRVSRRTTLSPADVTFLNFSESKNDRRRREILQGKIGALEAIQHGSDVDYNPLFGKNQDPHGDIFEKVDRAEQFASMIERLVRFAGTSEGVRKSWEKRERAKAKTESAEAPRSGEVPHRAVVDKVQNDVLKKSGIPEDEMASYVQSSIADGKKLRGASESVAKGEISVDDAAKTVREDWESAQKNIASMVSTKPGNIRSGISKETGDTELKQYHNEITSVLDPNGEGKIGFLKDMGIEHDLNSTYGSYEGVERTFAITLKSNDPKEAEMVGTLLANALHQDSFVTSRPDLNGPLHGVSFSKPDGAAFSLGEIQEIAATANPTKDPNGHNFSVSNNQKSIRFLDFSDDNEKFKDDLSSKLKQSNLQLYGTKFRQTGNLVGQNEYQDRIRQIWMERGDAGRSDLQRTYTDLVQRIQTIYQKHVTSSGWKTVDPKSVAYSAMAERLIRFAGTSEGVQKAWETRKGGVPSPDQGSANLPALKKPGMWDRLKEKLGIGSKEYKTPDSVLKERAKRESNYLTQPGVHIHSKEGRLRWSDKMIFADRDQSAAAYKAWETRRRAIKDAAKTAGKQGAKNEEEKSVKKKPVDKSDAKQEGVTKKGRGGQGVALKNNPDVITRGKRTIDPKTKKYTPAEYFQHGKKITDPKTLERLNKTKIGPQMYPVWINPEKGADLVAIGVSITKKGTVNEAPVYSADHWVKAAAEKWARVKIYDANIGKLRAGMDKDMTSQDPKIKESAIGTYIMDLTSIRVGSGADTGAAKKAYGTMTLEARHVRVTGNSVQFVFTGKSGVAWNRTVDDPKLARAMKGLLAGKERGDRIFQNANSSDVSKYFKSYMGDKIKPKDQRSWKGTVEAAKAMDEYVKKGLPSDQKSLKLIVKDISVRVSKHLGNTPGVAKSTYIAPAIWGPLLKQGLKKI